MPGANNTFRKTKGISIFEIPKTSNLTQEEQRNELVNVIKRHRESKFEETHQERLIPYLWETL